MKDRVLKLIDTVLSSCDDIIHCIEEQKIEMNYIIDFITLIDTLSKNIYKLQNNELSIDELNEKLECLLNALEEKDMELFSDTLQYELKPLLEYWKETI